MDEMRVLTSSPLFAGINGAEAAAMLRCLSPYQRSFHAGGTILRAGEAAVGMGLVLEGSVRLEHVDAWGGRRILERFEPGATFAEAYACAAGEPLLVDVVAETDCTVLFLDAGARVAPLSQRLCLPRPPRAQPACGDGEKEPPALAQDTPHHAAHHPRTPARLPLWRGSTPWRTHVRHPLRPPATGRLSGRGAQCPFGRAFQNASRGPHRVP